MGVTRGRGASPDRLHGTCAGAGAAARGRAAPLEDLLWARPEVVIGRPRSAHYGMYGKPTTHSDSVFIIGLRTI